MLSIINLTRLNYTSKNGPDRFKSTENIPLGSELVQLYIKKPFKAMHTVFGNVYIIRQNYKHVHICVTLLN